MEDGVLWVPNGNDVTASVVADGLAGEPAGLRAGDAAPRGSTAA